MKQKIHVEQAESSPFLLTACRPDSSAKKTSPVWRLVCLTMTLLVLLLGSSGARAQTNGSSTGEQAEAEFFRPALDKSLSDRQQSLHTRLLEAETSADVQLVRVQPDQLLSKAQVRFNVGESIGISLERSSMQRRGAENYTWIGQNDLLNNAVLVVRNGQVTGSIRRDGQLYSIKPLTGDLHALVTVDEATFPGDHPSMFDDHPNEDAGSPHRGSSNGSADTPTPSPSSALGSPGAAGMPLASTASESTSQTLDVIVAYTPQADADVADMEALVQLAVDETNLSYANSGVETRIELVHLHATTTNSTDDMSVELEQFRTPGDGAFDEIHDLRETYGADIVKLIGDVASSYNACGLASVIEARTAADAFAITAHNCATGTYTFAHEIGHLQGARHDRNADDSLFPYAFGHGTTDTVNGFRTVMAYNDNQRCPGGICTRVPHWSSPNADAAYDDIITGNETYQNNASVIDLTAPHLASFAGAQPTAQPQFTTSTSSVERVLTPGETATETVTITNSGDRELYWRATQSGEIKTSDDPEGPSFEWTDISQSPTATSLGTTGLSEIELPFAFSFYDNTYTDAVVGFNGVIYFEDRPYGIYDPAFYRNAMIPSRFEQDAFIAPFWSLFWPEAGGEVFMDTDDDGRLVLQWHEVRVFGTELDYTFQAILSPDGSICFQYHTIPDPSTSASVGLENSEGTGGVRAAFLGGYLSDAYEEILPTDGRALSIQNYNVVSAPSYEGRIDPGASMDVPLTLNPGGRVDGTFVRELTFTTNEPGTPSYTVPINLTIEPIPNQALVLDGTDDYVTADAVSDTISTSDAFTLEAWVRPKANSSIDRQHTVLGFHASGGNNRNVLFYDPAGVNGATHGQFRYYDDAEGSTYSRDAFPGGEWVHVAMTVDASDHGTLYVNGRREATFTTAVRPDADGLFSIGQDWDAGPVATDFFDGRIDEVRIWSVARSQAEIQAGLSTALGEANDLDGAAGLVAHYRFERNALDAARLQDGTLDGDPSYADDVPVETAEDRLVVRVNAAVSGGTGSGTSWANAHARLQDGLSGTGPENQVWIAGGTYYPDEGASVTDNDPDKSFTVTGDQDGLQVYGGFAGTEAQVSERTSGFETILSGDIQQDDTAFAPLTDSDGDPNTATQTDHIIGTNSRHVVLIDGGAYEAFGTDVAANVTTETLLDGVTITAGDATQASPFAGGGGLVCDGFGAGNECSPRVTGLVVAGNRAGNAGGLVFGGQNDGATSPILTNILFIGNEAIQISDEGFGGALGIYGSGTPQITNATFVRNRASENGGAVDFYSRNERDLQPQVTNSIFRSNTAPDGPQIVNEGGVTLTISHTVLEGGLAAISEIDGSVTIDGGGNLDVDPLFADPSDPDGSDDMFGTEDDGFLLTGGSPALDAGTNTPFESGGVADGLTTDLRLGDRILDNDGDASTAAIVDLGAYEAPEDTQIPVEFAGFEATASSETVTLSWRTLTETNNVGFDIERREGETGSWTTLQRVSGAGTTTEAQTYRFEDTALPYAADALTYRLRQVDVDGTESLSNEVSITRSLDNLELLGTYPNPARQQATVRFGVPKGTDDARLVLYDLLGRAVQQVQVDDAGRQTLTLRTGGLASGVYFLRLTGDGQVRTEKLTVVR